MPDQLIPTVISLIALYLAWRQNRLQERALPPEALVSPGRERILAVWRKGWPTIVMIGLVWLVWIPFLAPRFGQPQQQSPTASVVTPDNVEQRLRRWLDAFQMSSSVHEGIQPSHFAYLVTLRTGVKIIIERQKARERYLYLTANIVIDQASKDPLLRMSPAQQTRLRADLMVRLATAQVHFSIPQPWESILLHKRVPITQDLTEATLIDAIEAMEFAAITAVNTMQLHLPIDAQK